MTPTRANGRRAGATDPDRTGDRFRELATVIRQNAVRTWVDDRLDHPTAENLAYLAKFAYLTGLINKSEIGAYLGLDRAQVKALVRRWYEEHRKSGCGMC